MSIISENPELINVRNEKTGLSPVEIAFMIELQQNKMEISTYLLEKGAEFDVNKKYRIGYSAFDMAIVYGNYDAVEYMIKLGADINSVRERDGKTPLINAITRNCEEIAVLLITNNSEINTNDINGRPPIYYAVKKDQSEVIQKLLDKEAEINYIDDSGDHFYIRGMTRE